MNLEQTLNWRYSTKSFNPEKKISETDFELLKKALQMSPSSVNLQPWHFIIAQTEEGKQRVTKGAEGFFSFNASKITNASHAVVFCAKTDLTEDYLLQVMEQEVKDGRIPNDEVRQRMHGSRSLFADIHKFDLKDAQHWMEKQVYLNIGNFLLSAASLGIDAVPMEGLDFKAIDTEFGLREKGYTSIVVVGLGYRAEEDFNDPNKTPKSRFPESEIMTVI